MSIKEVLAVPPVQAVALSVQAAGGRAWLVGGAVRDALLGRVSKDLDLEVHGLEAEVLQRVLGGLGRPKAVGRSFGVFKVVLAGAELDVGLPRGDSAAGGRGEVVGDPSLTIEEACLRRDLTINAIAADPLTGELCDPTGGQRDLVARRLCAVSATRFGDDPLRALRVARFAGVLGFAPDAELRGLCAVQSLAEVPGERILPELEKLLLQAPRPSVGLEVGEQTGVLPQVVGRLDWDGAAVDRAAALSAELDQPMERLAVLLAVWLSQHADVEAVLDRLRLHRSGGVPVRERVLRLVEWQGRVTATWGASELRHAAERVPVRWLLWSAAALDPTLPWRELWTLAVEAGVGEGPLPILVRGRDLVAAGVPAGPALGRALTAVREAQLNGTVATRSEALELATAGSRQVGDADPAGR
jgi:hypothetical protein